MVLGYFAFLDFGLGDAVIKYVNHYYTLKEYQKINAIISSILALYLGIGVLGGALIIIFAKFFALDLFKIAPESRIDALHCFYISAFGFLLNLIFAVLSKIPEAVQRFDIRDLEIINIPVIISSCFAKKGGYGHEDIGFDSEWSDNFNG